MKPDLKPKPTPMPILQPLQAPARPKMRTGATGAQSKAPEEDEEWNW